ncbi:MAG: hypothetical protein WC943_13680 [Elusimicrobiota bacterium]
MTLILCVCVLNATAGSGILAAAQPRLAPAPASAGPADPVASLTAALSDALDQASAQGGPALAAQGLENDALDPDGSDGLSSAAAALLRTVSHPRLVADLRSFVLRRAGHPDAAAALSLLRRWEKLLQDPASRAGLLTGLAGAGGLGSSMAGSPGEDPSGLASASGSPLMAKQTTATTSPLSSSAALFPGSETGILFPYKPTHSGLSPPGRSPPPTHPLPLSPSSPKQAPPSSSTPDGTITDPGSIPLNSPWTMLWPGAARGTQQLSRR